MIKNKTLLELFSCTGSVGRVAESLGYSVISLDLKEAKVVTDILEWDYRQLKPDEIDVIWASPIDDANKIIKKTLEIIDYFKPHYFFIENPQAGLFNQDLMNGINFYDVDYCKYGFRYRKQTRIWTNCKTWKPHPLCNRDCGNIKWGRHIGTGHCEPSGRQSQYLHPIPATLISEIFLSLEF